MGIVKDLWIEAYEELCSEAEEAGQPVNEDRLGEMAHQKVIDRIADMADAAKDRAKYGQ